MDCLAICLNRKPHVAYGKRVQRQQPFTPMCDASTPRETFPRPALTVDIAVFSRSSPRQVLLIRRHNDPFAGLWALPGGVVDENEPLDRAAQRELHEETGLVTSDLTQIGAFGDPGRDPRGWTVTVAYLAQLDPSAVSLSAGDDAADARWFPWDQLPELAFDHEKILRAAWERISLSGDRPSTSSPAKP